ncbi:acyl-CoA reductase-like NAD-dependent aldehyde dehydrogenase [Gracilibacillus halotolerans]|uniref:Acyl-CoA reductase-like NAD-dependent aldehyde dehydrogenase n=1 Tax=Gracilibacillus halotolerans TaxID=74386 RepID=A0A841RLH0_9BACI|nr:aldehyde dehydrogenase family protein [Gracilibacillus halotolerans]MBB6512727.1 acyl-CoA reductase-like NAD-dependent aldehyde dehydrogenase [Gracilibacillus halotolerans]
MKQYSLLIDGEWLNTDEKIQVTDKYKQEPIAEVSKADKKLVLQAIDSAEDAFKNNTLSAYERYQILYKAANLLQEQKEEMAQIIMQEAGKPIKQSRGEVDRAVETLLVSAEEAKRITGEGVPVESAPGSENRLAFTIRVPVGIVAAISPFNFPLNLVAHKIAPALAAGNTVILKPASQTPISAIKLAEILQEAGLPAGMLHVLPGPGSTVGNVLMEDERIALYTFTGSTDVGLQFKQKTGLKKLILELGNNSPVIVDKDADLTKASKAIAAQSFAYAGQVCIAVQRVYLHKEIREEFLTKFLDEIKALNVGNPSDPTTDIGPMIDEKEAKRAEEWIQEAVRNGATIAYGGNREGALLEPTVLTNVSRNMKVVCEEIFAPVVTITEFENIDDCLIDVNQSKYGLQGAIFTNNINTAFYAAKHMEVGGMMVNDASSYRVDLMPYGGVKNSGSGKEGPKYTIKEMTNEKLIVLNLDF